MGADPRGPSHLSCGLRRAPREPALGSHPRTESEAPHGLSVPSPPCPGAPERVPGLSPFPEAPEERGPHPPPVPRRALASYCVDEDVVLGAQAVAPCQLPEQLLPKLPLEQNGAAQEGELGVLGRGETASGFLSWVPSRLQPNRLAFCSHTGPETLRVPPREDPSHSCAHALEGLYPWRGAPQ